MKRNNKTIEVTVEDSFEALDKIRPVKGIITTGIVTISKLRIKFDENIISQEQILKTLKGNI